MKNIALLIPITILYFVIGCDSDDPVSPNDATVTDINGNVYQTVKIGDQLWMAENLRVTRYRNGAVMATNHTDTEWFNTTSGAYAIYPNTQVDGINSDAQMVNAYGILYNWFAVDDSRGLCPVGWHVPSDAEWKQLEMHLGMTQQEADEIFWRGTDEGGKLKSTRTEPEAHPRWKSPNTGATNESGFSVLPGGIRGNNSRYIGLGTNGYLWSSTELDPSVVWGRYLDSDEGNVNRFFGGKRSGMSVRCLRDE